MNGDLQQQLNDLIEVYADFPKHRRFVEPPNVPMAIYGADDKAAEDVQMSRGNLFTSKPRAADRYTQSLSRNPSDREARHVRSILQAFKQPQASYDETLLQADKRLADTKREEETQAYQPTLMRRKRQMVGDEASMAENQDPLISKLLSQLTPEDLEKLTRMQGAIAESTFREQPQEVVSTDEPIDPHFSLNDPRRPPIHEIVLPLEEDIPRNLSHSPQYREFAEKEAGTRRQRQKRLQGGY